MHARPRPAWRKGLSYLTRTTGLRGAAFEILLASAFLQILGLALPLMTGYVVNRVLPNESSDLLTGLGVGILAIVAVVVGLGFARARMLVYLRARLDTHLMLGFFEHLLSLPYRFFEGRKTGQLVSRLSSNAILRDTVTNQTLSAILDGTLIIGYVTVLLIVAPGFGLVVLAIAALQVVVVWLSAGSIQRIAAREFVRLRGIAGVSG
jgi:ABC-type bacteriocin/lantibiotic exporter with double-glycine peptidase domain